MRVYHERLWVPVSWWLLGLAVIVILGAELAAGFGWPVAAAIYAVLVAGWAAMLLSWGRPRVEVAGGELIVGGARLALAGAGQVSVLDRAQTRAITGPRADPAAFSAGPVTGSRVFPTESTIGSTVLWTGSRTGSAGAKISSTGARI